MSVRALESLDLQGGIPEEADDFNLLFVSIAAWHKLMEEYEAEVSQFFTHFHFVILYMFIYLIYTFIYSFIYLFVHLHVCVCLFDLLTTTKINATSPANRQNKKHECNCRSTDGALRRL
jgi:hypothetical protein